MNKIKENNNILKKASEKIISLVNSKKLIIPKNFSIELALEDAMLEIREKGYDKTCTQSSIANALLQMTTQALSVNKKQCYFISYGNKLTCFRSYFGNLAIAERLKIKNINAIIVHEKDELLFEIDNKGFTKITKHKQTLESLDSEIVACYVVFEKNNVLYTTIMNKKEIQKSWDMSPMKNSKARNNFEGEMMKRTVINRALKYIINASSDAYLYEEKEIIELKEEAREVKIEEIKRETASIEVNENIEIEIKEEEKEETKEEKKEKEETKKEKEETKKEKKEKKEKEGFAEDFDEDFDEEF